MFNNTYFKTYALIAVIICCSFCRTGIHKTKQQNAVKDSIVKIEMTLSAFGVESDGFPSIDAYIDFRKDSSRCIRSFYNPAYKGSTYSLNKEELQNILSILAKTKLDTLKKEYTVNMSDQPTSTTTIYSSSQKFIIKDYGLRGDSALQELYKIVYKLK